MDPVGKSSASEPCPNCGKPIPIDSRFPKWCSNCEWNLSRPDRDESQSVLGRIYSSMGQTSSNKLFNSLVETDVNSLKPGFNLSRVAALCISVAVHLSSVLVAVGGASLIFYDWPNVFPIIIGTGLIGFAFLLRPRFGWIPQNCLTPEGSPHLFNLVHEICDHLKVRRINHILISGEFNASVRNLGIHQTPLMVIGMPLWLALDDRQRVAVLAHEIAHTANGDPARSTVISSALDSLSMWHQSLAPELGLGLTDVVLKPAALVVEVIMWGLSFLLWRDNQRAEYLADYLATKVSGTDAMTELLDRIRVSRDVLGKVLLGQTTSSATSGVTLLKKYQKDITDLPEHEQDRLRRIDRMTNGSLDDTHPPTELRISFLRHHPIGTAQIVLSDERSKALEIELENFVEPVGDLLLSAVLEDE